MKGPTRLMCDSESDVYPDLNRARPQHTLVGMVAPENPQSIDEYVVTGVLDITL
jgi:hypothetical protein